MIEEAENNNVVKSKRKRSSKACDVCHKKKIKCDGNNPCSNCIDSKIPCVYSPRTKKRGPRAGYIGIIEKKLRDMESFLMDHGINCFTNQPNGEFNNNLSTEGKISSSMSTNNKNSSTIDIEKINEEDNLKSVSEESPEFETKIIMPLIEIFFKSVNTHMPVLHKLTFYDKLKSENKVSPLLLNAIYLVSTRYVNDPENYSPESILLKKVKILLEKSISKPSMETLQAMIILSVHFSGMSIGSSEWIYSGMAHRMAQLLKYNKEYPNMGEDDIGPFEKEYRKRLWWICYLNDKYVSAFANRPLLIDENDTYIALPVETKIWETIKTDEEYEKQNFQQIYFKSDLPYIPTTVELNLFSRQIILGALLGKVLTFKEHQHEKINEDYVVTTDSDIALLDTSLKNWYRSLPEKITNLDNYNIDIKTIWLNSFLLVKYYTTLILLHQPFISKRANREIEAAINLRNTWFTSHSYDTCMASVEAISNILDNVIQTNNVTIISPFFIFCVFESCIVILVNIINSKIDSSSVDKKFEKFLAIHLSLLLRIRDRWRIARIYLERFFEICKFFDYNFEYACIDNGIDPNPISLSYSQLTFNDTVTDNVIAGSNWLNFLTILNNIKNYFNTNNKLTNLANNDIVDPSSLNIIDNPNNINDISSVSLKDKDSDILIKQDSEDDSKINNFYYNSTISTNYQQSQEPIVMPKAESLYENSLKSAQSQPDMTPTQENTHGSLISIPQSVVKSFDISTLPAYNTSEQQKLVNSTTSLNNNENLEHIPSSLPTYSELPLNEITSTSSNLYSQISGNIISNDNDSGLDYLYIHPDIINSTGQQNKQTYYNYINNNTVTSLNPDSNK